MDPSLKPDPNRKGSYYRRIEDIGRALKRLDAEQLPPAVRFLVCYFGCEKLARGIVGIHKRWSANKAYGHDTKLRLDDTKSAAAALNLSIPIDDLNYVFANEQEQQLLLAANSPFQRSARNLRNVLGHDFGPSNVGLILDHADFLIPKMIKFLDCASEALAYQRAHFSGIP
jgi:hypothetical protein